MLLLLTLHIVCGIIFLNEQLCRGTSACCSDSLRREVIAFFFFFDDYIEEKLTELHDELCKVLVPSVSEIREAIEKAAFSYLEK